MAAAADWSVPVLAEKLSALTENFHEHVEHSAQRATTLDERLSEIVKVAHAQANTLTEIVTGQKTTEKLLRTFLTVAGLMFAACSTVAAIWKIAAP